MERDDGASDGTARDPFSAVDILNFTIKTRADSHVLYASYA